MIFTPSGFITYFLFFFFNDTATTEIYTLSLHDALPISESGRQAPPALGGDRAGRDHPLRRAGAPHHLGDGPEPRAHRGDRKSTRLNSSHGYISYAVFCLKKKKKKTTLECTRYK